MSFSRGDCQRKRAQKHQNKTVFKNDLHDNSDRTKQLNSMSINEVCKRCSDIIQWKIQYRKYKALTKPAACNICKERKVKKAYHVLCRDCAIAVKQCAKCLKSDSEVEIIPPGPTAEEKLRMDIEMKALIRSLPERKRRTFMRFMNGKKKRKGKPDDDQDQAEDIGEEIEEVPRYRTREELLQKIEKLKGIDAEFYEGVAESEDDDWESGSEDFSSGDEAEL